MGVEGGARCDALLKEICCCVACVGLATCAAAFLLGASSMHLFSS